MTFLRLGAGVVPEDIGGKGAAWWRLHGLGVAVPDGFAVLPGDALAEEPLRQALDSLVERSGCMALAVRSSGATEDGEERSLAGLFISELDVPINATAAQEAVERCRRSGRSERARAALGGEEEPAVLVQEMVRPIWSGLLFTRDPRGGREGPVIELVHGHLRSLVDGGPPDLRATLDVEGRGAVESLLGDQRVDELMTMARIAEQALGGPADLEWAATERGLVLLQARPMTGLSCRQIQPGIELLPVHRAHAARMPREVQQHDKVALRLLADTLEIPISRGLVALCLHPRDAHVAELASALRGWGELIAVLLSPFRWQGRILRRLGAGATALEDLRGLFSELRAHEGWFALLLKELQPTARTGIAVRLGDGRVRAEIIHGHFASKGIADATSYLLSPGGELESVRVGRQTSQAVVEHGKLRTLPVESPAQLSEAEMAHLCEILRRLSPHHPEAGIELGYTPAGELFLVDLYEGTAVAPRSESHEVVCEGRVVGRVRYVDLDESAVEKSIERHVHDAREGAADSAGEPEILVVQRPYHFLDRLVYSAAPGALGIVFEGGSLLCHLAVVMREKGVPGLLLPEVRGVVSNGDRALLDTRPGSTARLKKL